MGICESKELEPVTPKQDNADHSAAQRIQQQREQQLQQQRQQHEAQIQREQQQEQYQYQQQLRLRQSQVQAEKQKRQRSKERKEHEQIFLEHRSNSYLQAHGVNANAEQTTQQIQPDSNPQFQPKPNKSNKTPDEESHPHHHPHQHQHQHHQHHQIEADDDNQTQKQTPRHSQNTTHNSNTTTTNNNNNSNNNNNVTNATRIEDEQQDQNKNSEKEASLQAHLDSLQKSALLVENKLISREKDQLRQSIKENKLHKKPEVDAVYEYAVATSGDDDAADDDNIHKMVDEHQTHSKKFVRDHRKSIHIHDMHNEVETKVKHMLENLNNLDGDGKYVDIQFKASSDLRDEMWMRPDRLRYNGVQMIDPDALYSLFDNPQPEDAKQGTLGDCWLISSMSVLAGYNNGQLLRGLFPGQNDTYNKRGAFVVRLCNGGMWETVLIDDIMPCLDGGAWDDSNRCLAFCGTVRQQMWAPLIEKACAKLCRSYTNLIAGQGAEALAILTGWPAQVYDCDVDEEAFPKLWETLTVASSKGNLMIISTNDAAPATGLVPNHAYALNRVVEVRANQRSCKLFQIHNPHGHGEWNGSWSDNASEWTPETMRQANMSDSDRDKDDGTFWMQWEDVKIHFDDITVCKVDHSWTESRYQITMHNTFDKPTSAIEFTLSEESEVNLSLTQTSQRALAKTDRSFCDVSFVLLRIPKTMTGAIHPSLCEYVGSSLLSLKGTTIIDNTTLEKGRYLMVPFTFKNKKSGGIAKTITFVALSNKKMKLCEHLLNVGQTRTALRSYICHGGVKSASEKFPVTNYYRSDGNGFLMWEENRSNKDGVNFKLSFDVFGGMQSSREGQEVEDYVPPGHGKLIGVALSVGLIDGDDVSYSWKMGWSTCKHKTSTLDVGDIHCPILNKSIHSDTSLLNLKVSREKPHRVSTEALVLSNTFDGVHPCVVFTIGDESECAIVMSDSEANTIDKTLVDEAPEVETNNATDYSFVVLKLETDSDKEDLLLDVIQKSTAVTSAPMNVVGETEVESTLTPGRYCLVPFNFGKKATSATVSVTISIHSTASIEHTPREIKGIAPYQAALREYVLHKTEKTEYEHDASIKRCVRLDGHGLMMWIENPSHKWLKHLLQFASLDNVSTTRGVSSEKWVDVIPPRSGKLVTCVWPNDISAGYDTSYGSGWVTSAAQIKDDINNNNSSDTIHSTLPLLSSH